MDPTGLSLPHKDVPGQGLMTDRVLKKVERWLSSPDDFPGRIETAGKYRGLDTPA
jgi:hypothetical protein